MLDQVINIGRSLAREFRVRRELRDLLEKDERFLDDIGVRRADVESALAQPIGFGTRREAERLSRPAFYTDGKRLSHGRR